MISAQFGKVSDMTELTGMNRSFRIIGNILGNILSSRLISYSRRISFFLAESKSNQSF
jgi:hypothetical protein